METKNMLEAKENNVDNKKSNSAKTVSIKIKYRTIVIITALLVVFIAGIIIGHAIGNKESKSLDNGIINIVPDIDVTYLNTSLKEASELTTAKLKINGLVNFKDSGIILVNKSDFIMKYTAEISAGIDMSRVKIKEEDINHEKKTVIVKIPKATVFKPNVYHGNEYIEFYDEKFALFNVDEREDLSEALAMAEDDAKQEAIDNGLLELADKQSATLIKGILSDALSPTGYAVEIQYIGKGE